MAKAMEVDVPDISDMVARLDISHRTLLRLTNRHFGYPPKRLMRRTRFLRVLTSMLTAEEEPDHASVPSGYHDVPHFLRDAKSFLDLTPRRFLALPMPYLRAVLRARTMVIGSPIPILDKTESDRGMSPIAAKYVC